MSPRDMERFTQRLSHFRVEDIVPFQQYLSTYSTVDVHTMKFALLELVEACNRTIKNRE